MDDLDFWASLKGPLQLHATPTASTASAASPTSPARRGRGSPKPKHNTRYSSGGGRAGAPHPGSFTSLSEERDRLQERAGRPGSAGRSGRARSRDRPSSGGSPLRRDPQSIAAALLSGQSNTTSSTSSSSSISTGKAIAKAAGRRSRGRSPASSSKKAVASSGYGQRSSSGLRRSHSKSRAGGSGDRGRSGDDRGGGREQHADGLPGTGASREELLGWLRRELRRRGVGSSQLMSLMDNDRSGTATFNEFSGGLTAANFALKRDEYMRLFKAVDFNGDRSLSIEELREHLYGASSNRVTNADSTFLKDRTYSTRT